MKKEKQIKSYTRRTKSGKTVTVRAHSAKYDAADDLVKSLLKKKGSGKEFEHAVDTKGVDKLIKDRGDGDFQFVDAHEVPRRNRKFFDKVFSAYEDESDKY